MACRPILHPQYERPGDIIGRLMDAVDPAGCRCPASSRRTRPRGTPAISVGRSWGRSLDCLLAHGDDMYEN
jgi:hypothetical protein